MNNVLFVLFYLMAYTALKSNDGHFIINGNYRSSEDGIYEYNEDVFDYNKEIGLITAEGPLRNPVLVLVIVNILLKSKSSYH